MELNEATVAKLIEQMAAATAASQAATQTAQQIAQSTNQMISDLAAKMAQSTSTQAAQVVMDETHAGERLDTETVDRSGLMFSNQKRTFDEYQHESLESIKRNRAYVDKVLSDAATHDNRSRVIAEQALQNAVETANMVSKQAVRHSDIAIDRQWNVDEQGYTAEEILGNQTFKEGIRATVVAAVAEALAANAAATKK